MGLAVVRFLSLLFAVLAFAPTAAHLLELPSKIGLSRADYAVVQQIYRGWQFTGIAVFGALACTIVLGFMVRDRPRALACAIVAIVAIIGTQIVFWTFTFPVNQETLNWAVLPDHWVALRNRWEYSHAASGVLNVVAVCALIVGLLVRDEQ
jgi:hypothetical protein